MKITLLLLLLLTQTSCTRLAASTDTTVYICDSQAGKKYHLKATCKGLGTCQHKVVAVSLKEAKRRGRTLCAYEK